MAYLSSNKIEVFPATRRTFNPTTSRLFTEHATTGIVRNLIDGVGFVSSQLRKGYTGSDPFIFNIYGYYFSTLLGYLTDLNYYDVYANIRIDPGNNEHYSELRGIDDNFDGSALPIYTGVDFTNSPQSGTDIYSLHLLHKNTLTGLYEVPQNSLYIFNLESVDIDLIDGGEI